MASGYTVTGSLADSLDTVIASARTVREFSGVMTQLVDRVTMEDNTGLSWIEAAIANLTAQGVTESTELNNPQQYSDTLITLTPEMSGICTFVSDRVKRRVSKKTLGVLGTQGQAAIERRKDIDGLTYLDAASTSLGGAGVTLTPGHIAAAKYQITSNSTEPGIGPYYAVLHGYQIKDLDDALVAGVGTGIVTDGPTADVFKNGFKLPVSGVEVYEDGNITIDSADDAKGGVFAKQGLILVQGKMPWMETKREPQRGGGGETIYMYDEWAFGERSSGNWVKEIYSDATTPTS